MTWLTAIRLGVSFATAGATIVGAFCLGWLSAKVGGNDSPWWQQDSKRGALRWP